MLSDPLLVRSEVPLVSHIALSITEIDAENDSAQSIASLSPDQVVLIYTCVQAAVAALIKADYVGSPPISLPPKASTSWDDLKAGMPLVVPPVHWDPSMERWVGCTHL